MPMTERYAERVEPLISCIRTAPSCAYAEHYAVLTLNYIEQLHQLDIIDEEQFYGLVIAVNDAADAWKPSVDHDGRLLDD
jgi:hypothetical protein